MEHKVDRGTPPVSRRLHCHSNSQSSSDSFNVSSPGADSLVDSVLGHAVPSVSCHTDNTDCSAGGRRMCSSASGRGSALTRKQSYKDQRRRYRHEKRRAADELLSTLRDPAVLVRSDWLKVRGTLKSWTKVWAVLKPGLLLLYRSEKTKVSHWVGTVLLASCRLIERPSKKTGFCFKLFHPLDQSIWSTKGPDGETHTVAGLFQLPTAYLICRASSQSVGKCWMDALELCVSCSSLLKSSMQQSATSTSTSTSAATGVTSLFAAASSSGETTSYMSEAGGSLLLADSDTDSATDNLFGSCLLSPATVDTTFGDDVTDDGRTMIDGDDSSDDASTCDADKSAELETSTSPCLPAETNYVANDEVIHTEFGVEGTSAGGQTEELGDDNKNLLWFLIKQLRPGMDLSKVVLPTFILEPRSFLDKLSDYYYHADLLSSVVSVDDPFVRIKRIVAWYLSGFYKKPKGLKKPYNPILGETFRCYWQHANGSRTFYIAEQVSHHPPISAFYVSNRRDGFSISSTILAKSKFYGNSTSAILDGRASLTLLPRGEVYRINMPYAHCKGLLLGTLSVELGGKVVISCENTGYSAELDFKLRPLWSSYDECNRISGKIRLGRDTLALIDGKWDGLVSCTDKQTSVVETLWEPTAAVRARRLTRYTVPLSEQSACESERLWQLVSQHIITDDQAGATREKSLLEDEQRAAVRQRAADNTTWQTKHFQLDSVSGEYVYRYADTRPWDRHSDVRQFEADYRLLTETRLGAALLRATSVHNMPRGGATVAPSCCLPDKSGREVVKTTRAASACHSGARDSSSPESATMIEVPACRRRAAPTCLSPTCLSPTVSASNQQDARMQQLIRPLEQTQRTTAAQLAVLTRQMHALQLRVTAAERAPLTPSSGSVIALLLLVALVAVVVQLWRAFV